MFFKVRAKRKPSSQENSCVYILITRFSLTRNLQRNPNVFGEKHQHFLQFFNTGSTERPR